MFIKEKAAINVKTLTKYKYDTGVEGEWGGKKTADIKMEHIIKQNWWTSNKYMKIKTK